MNGRDTRRCDLTHLFEGRTKMSPKARLLQAIVLGGSLCVGLVITAVAPHSASAQGITTGGLYGEAVDPTGAVLPDASIVVVNDATGARSEQKSRGDGGFSLLNLPIGHYTITFTMPGFAGTMLKNVAVEVGVRNLGSI